MPKMRIDDSFEMFYETYDFTDPWKETDTVVLVHGNSRNSKTWRWYIPKLSGDYKVVTVDWRGRGQSTVPPPYSLSIWANDLKILLDKLGIDQVRYIGEATGGLIGLQFAHDYPERVKSLALLGSGPANQALLDTPTLTEIETVEREGVSGWHRSILSTRFDPEKADPGLVEWFLSITGAESRQSDADTKRYLRTINIMDLLPNIKTPTLILTAEHSPFGGENFKLMHQAIPNSEIQIFYGMEPHFIFLTHREECLKAVKAFWRRITP